MVPAREEGFQETVLGEDRWYAIRMHSSMIPKIKHLAVYRVAPLSAITHVASVRDIEHELGMTPAQASARYFSLRRSVWDVQNMDNSLIDSDESRALPPPRNWLGINDVYLVT